MVIDENADYVLKIRKIQCLFSMSLDTKHVFVTYYEPFQMDHTKRICAFYISVYVVCNFVNQNKKLHSVM